MVLNRSQDFWAGCMFAGIGAAFALGALNYSFGNSARPGAAYFPFGLGMLTAALGLLMVIKSLVKPKTDAADQVSPFVWRPFLLVVAAIVVFGLALPRLGLVVTLPLLITVISAAGSEFRWRDIALNSLVLTIGSWAVFIKGLGLILPLWPAFFN